MSQPYRDVFLSHAHTDKEAIVEPLARALRARMISTWVDQAQIAPGERILDAVSEGLSRARFVVVVITDAFLERNWTQDELAAAFARDTPGGALTVIPIVATGIETVRTSQPLLATRRALLWSNGIEAVADEIAAPFRRRADQFHIFIHRKEYVGRVWTRVGAPTDGRYHVELLWGPNILSLALDLSARQPVSLEHGKQRRDQVHLLVRCDPAAFVTAGEGAPPDPEVIEIDEGWTRARGWREAEESLEVGE